MFNELVQFVLMVLIALCVGVMFIGQILLSGEFHAYMIAVAVMLLLSIWGCVITWKEYKNGKES